MIRPDEIDDVVSWQLSKGISTGEYTPPAPDPRTELRGAFERLNAAWRQLIPAAQAFALSVQKFSQSGDKS